MGQTSLTAADRRGVYTGQILITHDVEEAVYMADRIIVLSPRPTNITATFHVSLPHPLTLASPEAQGLREAILEEL